MFKYGKRYINGQNVRNVLIGQITRDSFHCSKCRTELSLIRKGEKVFVGQSLGEVFRRSSKEKEF